MYFIALEEKTALNLFFYAPKQKKHCTVKIPNKSISHYFCALKTHHEDTQKGQSKKEVMHVKWYTQP